MKSKSNSDFGIHLVAVQGTSAKITENKFEAENEKFWISCFFVFSSPTKILPKTFHFFYLFLH